VNNHHNQVELMRLQDQLQDHDLTLIEYSGFKQEDELSPW
jgi:hypothetical protein